MAKADWQKVKFCAGIECHLQLDTREKLFCSCATSMREKKPIRVITRWQHPVASELGRIDVAAQYEWLRGRTFRYQMFEHETCDIDMDEEPPLPLNEEALVIALQVAMLFHLHIPEEIHVMRKTVIDGSTPFGFQRTATCGIDGFLSYGGKEIKITHLALEEDAAALVKEEGGEVTYRLNRLGVPLIEVGTGLLKGFTPRQIEDIAYQIGMTCRLTGRIKRGAEAIRQDVNVSVEGGARVEVKGIQRLGLISRVIEYEIQRQLSLLRLKAELARRGLRRLVTKPVDVTSLFEQTACRLISRLIRGGARVYAVKLPRFAGLLAYQLCPGHTFGRELVAHAGDLIHSDENLEKYSLQREFAQLRKQLGAGRTDAIVIMAMPPQEATKRIRWLIQRCQQALHGVPEETRAANPDGTTRYTRPLPGAARLYPETDIPPVRITARLLREVKKALPERLDVKLKKFTTVLKLSDDLTNQILRSEYLTLFERIVRQVGVRPTLIASTFTSTLRDLRRRGVRTEAIRDGHFIELFRLLDERKLIKEAIPQILAHIAQKPEMGVLAAVEQLKLTPISLAELKAAIRKVIRQNPTAPERKIVGLVMSQVRGRAEAEQVVRTVRQLIKKKRSL